MVRERPDIFGDWEEALDEMRRALDRIDDGREQSSPDARQEDDPRDEG
jgi:hypothetical protein